jgi:hypothetical protein
VNRAYKFLTADGHGVFSGFAWPLPTNGPGAWLEADVDVCRSGIHACRTIDLPHWLAPALYEIELDGPLDEQPFKVVAPRGRLIRRDAYSKMCIARAHELVAEAPEVAGWAPPPTIGFSEAARLGFIAARIAEQLGGFDANRDERRRQSEWLVERLALA